MRISKINHAGQWSFDNQQNTFEDSFFRIEHTGSEKQAFLTVKKNAESLVSTRKPTQMLCNSGKYSALYVNFVFQKKALDTGFYTIKDNTFLLTHEGVYIINLPADTKKLTFSQASEINFDPKALYLDSSFLQTIARQTK
jgi:hypothetical protein